MMPVTKLTRFDYTFLGQWSAKLCSFFGHRWLYKDYSNYIQADGSQYAFKASRNCTRCKAHAYFYSEWVEQAKSEIDYVGDYNAKHTIVINKVIYS